MTAETDEKRLLPRGAGRTDDKDAAENAAPCDPLTDEGDETAAPDEEVLAVSSGLIARYRRAYEELAQ